MQLIGIYSIIVVIYCCRLVYSFVGMERLCMRWYLLRHKGGRKKEEEEE